MTCKLIILSIVLFLMYYILMHCGKEYYRASWCPDSNYDSKSLSVLDYPSFQLACGKGRNENYIKFEPVTFSALKTPLMLRGDNKKIKVAEKFSFQDPQFQNKYKNLVGSNQARNYQKKLNEQFCGGCSM